MLTFKPRHIPNFISLLRIFLTLPVGYFLAQRHYQFALWLFLLAGVSDGLDGFLAKHYGWQSRLGGLLDPLADKLLLVTCFLILGITGLIPLWLVIAALARDALIIGGAMYYHFYVEDVQPAPTWVSKFNTLLQLLLVVLVTIDVGWYSLPPTLLIGLQGLLLTTLIISGIHYVIVWSRKALLQDWRT